LAWQVQETLGVPATLRTDHTPTGFRWRIEVHSRELLGLLEWLGIDLTARAATKRVPGAIRRSPGNVVAAFLRGYFDADGYAGPDGVILSSASDELIRTVQVLLLNFGILSTRRAQADGCWHLEVKGIAADVFRRTIGFG